MYTYIVISQRTKPPRLVRGFSSHVQKLDPQTFTLCELENPPFVIGKSTISIAIFNGYIELPEGTYLKGTIWL